MTVVTARKRIESLEALIEDRDLKILELETESALLQRQVRDLKQTSSLTPLPTNDSGRTALIAALARDDEVVKLNEQCNRLTLKLRLAEDERDALAAYARSGQAAIQLEALQKLFEQKSMELERTKVELNEKELRLSTLSDEMNAIKAHVTRQGNDIRTLQSSLSNVVQGEASDAAKAERLLAENLTLKEELDRKTRHLQRAAEALDRVRGRETTANAALAAQSASLAELQRGLSAATIEADRWRSELDNAHARLQEAADDTDALREAVENAQRKLEIGGEAMIEAVQSAEAVKALSKALEIAKTDIESMAQQMSTQQSESRREVLSLQKSLDEERAVIALLQTDLGAATAALNNAVSSSSPSVRQSDIDRVYSHQVHSILICTRIFIYSILFRKLY